MLTQLPDRTNIVKLKHGREGYVYRTARPSDKKALLSTFRKASDELTAKKRKQREGEHERRMSVWNAGGTGFEKFSLPDASSMPNLPAWAAETQGTSTGAGDTGKSKAEADARWISEFSDDFAVAVALKEWDSAVSLYEKGPFTPLLLISVQC